MKKPILFLALIAMVTCGLKAQDFQGVVTYQSKTSIDLNLEGREIPEERKQQIKERMKNAMENSYELTFNRAASTYIKQEKLETPTAGNGGRRGGPRFAFGGGGGDLYKNVQNQTYISQNDMFGKVFLVKDSLTNWEWKLGSETKKIGNYTVYKATVVQKNDTSMIDRFRSLRPGPRRGRGRGGEEEVKKDTIANDSTNSNSLLARIEAPKEKIITAWYTPEIPINQGPGNYWGLPGLILEVNDGRTAVLCNKIVLNPEEKVEIKEPTKGKEVNQEEYDKILSEKMKEMSDRFRGGNRRGGNGSGRTRG